VNTGGANIDGDWYILTTIVEDVAMTTGPTETSVPETFLVVEQMPEFPGGINEMMRYLARNTIYPPIAFDNDITGTVQVSFVINTDGKVVEVALAKGADRYLDKEALRVVNTMPAWKPGKQNGKKVRVKFTVPIRFQLQ
jgi:protein TonB